MASKMVFKYLCILFFASFALFSSYSQTVNGRVIDEKNAGIQGASVQLVNAGLTATSGVDGRWRITLPSSIESKMRKSILPTPLLKGSTLYFAVTGPDEPVKIGIYALGGRLIYRAVNRKLTPGFYRLGLSLPPAIYAVQFQIGYKTANFKLPLTESPAGYGYSSLNKTSTLPLQERLEKQMVVIDTVKVSKAGYAPAVVPLSSYQGDTLIMTLKTLIPAYYLNPPNPCYNQFYVKNCVPGDPNSSCGGNCSVANSCSPPEDPNKANLPKTFVCPRFMLYSTEMLQAAKDDAVLYGWGDGGDPPFNYGVVGHDPDVGGVDDVQSSCCQCYQLIYVTPEPSSPQPPDLPYPKPLIVQSFNTAASGPKGFDVFMGAGGYGAFNSCFKDPAFGNTSKFNEFIYDGFPYQNPGSGGISFLRFPECIQGWPPTIQGVLSAACQDKIKQMCDQALVTASVQITEDTKRSCIECNKLTSLYHQNWQIMVKRVRCPDNLTRVTGCRLLEPTLPLPLPAVKTPAEARANGTFRDGYNTTTMQDCCKPTCAWADWTVGYKLPVDGDWNSFYSCDKVGKPFTK
jgi:hypothetical protein